MTIIRGRKIKSGKWFFEKGKMIATCMKLVYNIRICCWQKNPRQRGGELFY